MCGPQITATAIPKRQSNTWGEIDTSLRFGEEWAWAQRPQMGWMPPLRPQQAGKGNQNKMPIDALANGNGNGGKEEGFLHYVDVS